MAKPALSVVVVHHRGEEHLQECLQALAVAGGGIGAETILVDNTGGSAAAGGSLDRVLARFPEVRRAGGGGNAGFAEGCRQGAEAAHAPLLAFVNDDAVVEPDALERLHAALEAAPADVVAVAGRLVDRTGRTNDFSDGFLTFDGHAFQQDVGRPLAEVRCGEPGEERLFACGGLMSVRRDAFFASGGFDDDYFAYLEDVDFGWRQWIFGNRVVAEPRAVARHRGGATGEALGLYSRGFLFEKNAFSTAYKNFDEDHFRALMPAILAAFTGRVAEMLATRNPGAADLANELPRSSEASPSKTPPFSGPREIGRVEVRGAPSRPVVASIGVLLVDPDRVGRTAIARALVRANSNVTVVDTAGELERAFADGETFDVAVLDAHHSAAEAIISALSAKLPRVAIVARSNEAAATRALLADRGITRFDVRSRDAPAEELVDAMARTLERA